MSVNLSKPTSVIACMLLLISCKQKENYIEDYISNYYPHAEVHLICYHEVDSAYMGLDKLIKIAHKLKVTSEGFKEEAHRIMTDDTAMLTWHNQLKNTLDNSDALMKKYIDEAREEISRLNLEEVLEDLEPNQSVIAATYSVDNDTLENLLYINTSSNKVCYSVRDVQKYVKRIDQLIAQWKSTYNETTHDFMMLFAEKGESFGNKSSV